MSIGEGNRVKIYSDRPDLLKRLARVTDVTRPVTLLPAGMTTRLSITMGSINEAVK